MTNLADLLPAGGGQNNTEFVADGNISAGAPVILTAAGKAAPIVSSGAGFGSEYEYESGLTYYSVFNYNTTQDRVVAFYSDMSNGDYPTAVVGSISGSVITWGTPVVIVSSAMSDYLAATYDANLDKHLVIAKISSQGKALMGTVTAATNTISFGATETFSTDNVSNFDCMYDPSTTKSLIVWRDSGSSPASSAVVATPASDSSISFGSVLDWTYGSAYAQDICCAYDTNQNKVVVGAWEIPANYEIANYVATITGTSVTFGSRQQAYSTSSHHGYYNNTAMDYDKSANAIVNFWRESGAGKCIAGTISGDSISYGSATAVGSDTEMQHAIYSDQSSSIALSYFASSTTYLQFFSTSGTTITVGSQITTDSAAWQYNANVYDPDNQAIIVGGTDGGDGSKGKSKVYEQDPTNLTSTNLLGLAPEAISDTATGTINTWGSRCENNDFFGTVTSTYGTPTDAISAFQSESKVLAYDSANNRFVMAYKDGSNSDYGTAVVGELSGTSITWGTPVVFNSATTGSEGLALAFDSNVNRMVIAYQDQGNSSYGTAIVGSVSGTGSGSTIAFGAESVFLSSSTAYIGMEFDSNDNRIVIVYSDVANATYTYRVEYVIGTVTTGPDAISFNTPAPINGNSGTYEPVGVCFDASENKILAAYTDNSYDLYVVNLAVSSGSGTPGTASSYSVGQERWPRAVYDSVNSKCGVSWATNTGAWPISFSVISMSGSSVTINTPVQAGATSDSNIFMHNMAFDSSVGQIAICTRSGSSVKGIVYYGSISGTTSSWATESLFVDETINAYGVDVAYDTSANKLAFVYTDNTSGTDSVVATLATTTLTIGSDYYVQTDGTLSTDTGGQLIGNAIKTNQINIKDYTG